MAERKLKMDDEERKTKRIIFPLLDDVNPIKLRSSLTQMFKERFFRLFASTIDIEGVMSEERLEIIKRIWNDGRNEQRARIFHADR